MGYSRRELPDEHGTHGPDEPPKRKPFEEALSWLEDIVPEAEKLDIDAWLRYRVKMAVQDLRVVLRVIQREVTS